jgi:uroporphyrinogen decarboxylase
MKACRREPVSYTPIWLMRQAGRYMKEYRDVRARVSMLELCKSPDLVSEVTVHAATRLGVDAAILFADLLLIVESFGLELEYAKNEGPVITPPVRDRQAVDRLPEVDPESLSYVYDAVRRTRADLDQQLPLIGFGGAPFTIASYLIEGRGTRSFEFTKRFMYEDEGAWNALMAKIVRGHIGYLNRQIEAGAQAIQIFDSWVGCLSPHDYRRYVQPHTAALISGLKAGAPIIHYWRVELNQEWERLGPEVAVMGNLDPLVLFGGADVVEQQAKRILDQAGGRPGHIFNLGHGILPRTPVDSVLRLVEYVHQISRR